MEWLKNENILKDYEKQENLEIENFKQYAAKTENVQRNKWKINGLKEESMFVTEL